MTRLRTFHESLIQLHRKLHGFNHGLRASEGNASLSFLSSLAKQELDIEVQCSDKALKAKVDNIKKSQTARKTEVDDFTKNWSDALLQSEKNVSASAQNVIGNLDSQYQAYFDAADSSLDKFAAMQALSLPMEA
jgi:hypothetical protein